MSKSQVQQFEETVRRGRPPGAKTRDVQQADGRLTSCVKCGSTSREPYRNKRVLSIAGIHPHTGQEFTQIVIRRTACSDCGQARDDRHFVYEPAQKKKA